MKKRKNILFITSDQQHFMTLGVLNKEIKTPNLDRLAKMGTLFNRAYTVNPTCTPTRATFITGLYPSQHGAYSLGTKLPEETLTVGDLLHKANYRTTLIGKAHFQQFTDHPKWRSVESNPLQQDLDFWRKYTDVDFYGFDHIELCRNHADEHHVGQQYAIWLEEQGFDWKPHFQKPAGTAEPQEWTWSLPEKYHYNSWIAQRTCEMIDDYCDNDENFFHWASFPDPHPPYLVPEPWASMYDPKDVTVPMVVAHEHDNNPKHFQMTQYANEVPDFSVYQEKYGNGLHGFHSHYKECVDYDFMAKNIAIYYGMVSFMDDCIGKILDKLEEKNLLEDTLIVFTTDHGHLFGQHGMNCKGSFHYEDLIKIPYIVAQKGSIAENVIREDLQSVVDLVPTFLDYANLEVPMQMTGFSRRENWEKAINHRESVVVENRHNPYKMNLRTLVTDKYKITVYCDSDEGELWDLENDPQELNNLWSNPNYSELKCKMLLAYARAELQKEVLPMPRVAGA